MKTLVELRLENQGYSCVGTRLVSDRWTKEHSDYKNHFRGIPTSRQIVKDILSGGARLVRLVSYDCKFPLDQVIVYVK